MLPCIILYWHILRDNCFMLFSFLFRFLTTVASSLITFKLISLVRLLPRMEYTRTYSISPLWCLLRIWNLSQSKLTSSSCPPVCCLLHAWKVALYLFRGSGQKSWSKCLIAIISLQDCCKRLNWPTCFYLCIPHNIFNREANMIHLKLNTDCVTLFLKTFDGPSISLRTANVSIPIYLVWCY